MLLVVSIKAVSESLIKFQDDQSTILLSLLTKISRCWEYNNDAYWNGDPYHMVSWRVEKQPLFHSDAN